MNISYDKTAILLINLGTPDDLSEQSIRKFLAEFLSDKRVIELNPLLWQFILRAIILPSRPKKVKAAYEKTWLYDHDMSPLRYYSQNQAKKLKATLQQQGYDHITVDYAMRYGNPSIKSKIHDLQQQGYNRIITFALYPQYSATTTASVHDEVFRSLLKMRFQPHIELIEPYYDHPSYIHALRSSINDRVAQLDYNIDAVLLSYHGIPKRYHDHGDPYMQHCLKTSEALQQLMPDVQILTSFQSRFGKEEWIKPYTDEMFQQLPNQGIKNLMVVCPGFAVDCIETLEEINIEGKEEFLEAGGHNFAMVPCLNDHDDHIQLFADLVKPKLKNSILS